MRIYTKSGDKGKTSLVTGTRVPKYHLRLEAYGTVDELNSYIGLIRSCGVLPKTNELLASVQNNLFVAGSLLAKDEKEISFELPCLPPAAVEQLEKAIDQMMGELPELTHFVLPAGHQSAAFCHVARTVCRRSERLVCRLAEESEVPTDVSVYLNRLSDYLFALSRFQNHQNKVDEVFWKPEEK